MIKYVGPKNGGVLPPLHNAVPERVEGDRFWFSSAYTMSFIRSERFATPLATTGSTLDAHPGALGQPGTGVLIGGDPANFGMIQGIRLGAGVFGGDCRRMVHRLGWAIIFFPVAPYAPRSIRMPPAIPSSPGPFSTLPPASNALFCGCLPRHCRARHSLRRYQDAVLQHRSQHLLPLQAGIGIDPF